MPFQVRRVVTGHDTAGESQVSFDGPPSNIREMPGWPGLYVNEIWVTEESPAQTTGAGDRALRPIRHDPANGGSIFRIIEIPPEQGLKIEASKTFEALQSGNQPTEAHKARHPGMHRTDSIDYVLVLAGECRMLLDRGEVTLRQGDCIVQRATSHAWVNHGRDPCVIAVVLIDGNSPFSKEASSP